METDVLTVEEVAKYVRSQPATVTNLLASGELAGFRVGGEWRVLGVAILEFLSRRMQEEQLQALKRAVSDPKSWAREARKHPEFLHMIESQDFQDNTFGNFLKSGLVALEAEEKPNKVVDIRRRRDED